MKDEHLKIEAFNPREKQGGQTVGMVRTGVKVTHIPSGIFAFSEVERSQFKNKKVAMAMVEYGLAEIGWKDE